MRQSDVRVLFIVLAAVPLSLVMLGFDVWFAYDFARQVQSSRYPSVTGTISQSLVKTSRGTRGSVHHTLDLRFTYEVEGRQYEARRVRFLSGGASSEPGDLARLYRVNSSVPVFYNPKDPSVAVLQPGANGADVLSLMYLGLFNLLALLCWGLVGMMSRDGSKVPSFEREGRTHVTLSPLSPSVVGVFASWAAMLLGTFASFSGYAPSVGTALGLWAAVLALGGVAAGVQRSRLRSGAFDLIVDERARQLSLPAGQGRRRRLDVPWSKIADITVETRGQQKKAYRPVLEFTGLPGARRRESLGEWSIYPERAQTLADWLRSRLKLPEPRAGEPLAGGRRTRSDASSSSGA
jgi:hypothetical protein